LVAGSVKRRMSSLAASWDTGAEYASRRNGACFDDFERDLTAMAPFPGLGF
jgi:hypothetical protein